MIYGDEYWWNFVIELEEKRQQIETKLNQGGNIDPETREEYVLITHLLGPLYQHLTGGGL